MAALPAGFRDHFVAAVAHVAPVWGDVPATLDKVDEVVREARRQGARLVVFGESFLPGFPLWAMVHAPVDTHGFFRDFAAAAVDVPGPETVRLAAVARRHGVHLSVGVTERSEVSGATLYNTNLLLGPDGTLLNRRRKLMPTWAERLVWAQGDVAELRPVRTVLGRVGVLICGENGNPLARYALTAQGEQVHLATYPPVWPFRREDPPDYAHWIELRTAAHAFEAKVFTLAAAAHLDGTAVAGSAGGDDRAEKLLRDAPSAASMIVGPGGEVVAGPVSGREGFACAEIRVQDSVTHRLAHDVAGHYQRHDLFHLTVDQRPQPAVRLLREGDGP